MNRPEGISPEAWSKADAVWCDLANMHMSRDGETEAIAKAIQSSVEAEREAILEIVDGYGAQWAAEGIALTIRSRKGA